MAVELIAPSGGRALSQSWTVWFNVGWAILEAANYLLSGPIGAMIPADVRVVIVAVVNFLLRLKTGQRIEGIFASRD